MMENTAQSFLQELNLVLPPSGKQHEAKVVGDKLATRIHAGNGGAFKTTIDISDGFDPAASARKIAKLFGMAQGLGLNELAEQLESVDDEEWDDIG